MEFFRNRDVRQQCLLFAVVLLAATGAAFSVSRQAALPVFLTGAVFAAISLLFTWRRTRDVQRLAEELDGFLHMETKGSSSGRGDMQMQHFREGDLEVLRDEIEKLLVRLSRQSALLMADKRQLSEALADISHQIRTPLTSLNLQAERLRSSALTEDERRALLREMTGMLSRIGWLVETLLKLSKLEAGTVVMRKEEFPAGELAREALKPFEISMEIHGQECIFDLSGEPAIRGDYTWTLEAVQNVIKNALEHTPEGGRIWISLRETPLFAEIIITDSGAGIADKDLPHVFERFYRGQNAAARNFGIGLALARSILAGENGVILAGNSKGRGGQFTMRFYR